MTTHFSVYGGRPVDGFDRVAATADERHAKRTGHMLRCQECGQRVVPSGLGVGSHRRKHDRERAARRDNPEGT